MGFVQTSLTSGCCAKKCDRTRSKGIGKGKNQTIMNVINLYISLLCFFHVKCSIDSVFSTWEQLVVFRFKFVSFVNKKKSFFQIKCSIDSVFSPWDGLVGSWYSCLRFAELNMIFEELITKIITRLRNVIN